MTVVVCTQKTLCADRLVERGVPGASAFNLSAVKLIKFDQSVDLTDIGGDKALAIGFSGKVQDIEAFTEKLHSKIEKSEKGTTLTRIIRDISDEQISKPNIDAIILGVKNIVEITTTNGQVKPVFSLRRISRTKVKKDNVVVQIGSGKQAVKTYSKLCPNLTATELVFLSSELDNGCGSGLAYYDEKHHAIRSKDDLTPTQKERVAKKVHDAILNHPTRHDNAISITRS